MTDSQSATKEPIMGRVDVLFRFLQLIGEDRPSDINKYLEPQGVLEEERPIVDQIVDRIIAGNEERYNKYEQAKQEVSSRNPYEEQEVREKVAESSLAFFLTRWINFEKALRIIATERGNEKEPFFSLLHKLQQPVIVSEQPNDKRPRGLFSPPEIETITKLSRLRNDIVHGVTAINDADLIEAGNETEVLLRRLLGRHPVNLRAKSSQSTVRSQ
jgi:hypothetical protein